MARILLADDDAAVRDVVRRALQSEGHEIAIAQDGQEALDLLLATPSAFDLIVSDVHMPGIDGLTLGAKAIAAAPKIKIVLMTAYADGADKASSLKPNLKTVLTKPLTLDQIRSAIRAALAG